MKNIVVLGILLGITILSARAQEVVSTSGNTYKNNTGSISFTVGECIIETNMIAGAKLTQGFHQTKLTVATIVESLESSIEVSAFPNPATEFVRLKVITDHQERLKYSLYDVQGVLIRQADLLDKETDVPFGQLKPSMYFIKIHSSKKEIKVFKIIKE